MQTEIHGNRDRCYSEWHRTASIKRFVGEKQALLLSMIDIDVPLYIEWSDGSRMPVALIETAIDIGQDIKTGTVLCNLARMAGLESYTLLYKLSADMNPAADGCNDIDSFRVRKTSPQFEQTWTHLTPNQWAQKLVQIRIAGARSVESRGIFPGHAIDRSDDIGF